MYKIENGYYTNERRIGMAERNHREKMKKQNSDADEIRISDDEMRIVLRKLFASKMPIQIVLITRPSVIRSEWMPSHEKQLTTAIATEKKIGVTKSVLLFFSR